MAMNDVMALILRYFTEFCSFRGALRKSDLRPIRTTRTYTGRMYGPYVRVHF